MIKRTAFYIPVGQFDVNGYIPSLVTENEAGHSPLDGGADGTPWYWGKTFEQAQEFAAKANADKGLSPQDVIDIVASSMASPTPRASDH
jgi:hypothetical protein